jgi:hypothetical protein
MERTSTPQAKVARCCKMQEPSPKCAKSNMGFGWIRDSGSQQSFDIASLVQPASKFNCSKSQDTRDISWLIPNSNIFELFSRTHQNYTPLPSLQRQGDCSCAPRHKRKAHHLEKLRYASLCYHSFTAFHISRRCPWKILEAPMALLPPPLRHGDHLPVRLTLNMKKKRTLRTAWYCFKLLYQVWSYSWIKCIQKGNKSKENICKRS